MNTSRQGMENKIKTEWKKPNKNRRILIFGEKGIEEKSGIRKTSVNRVENLEELCIRILIPLSMHWNVTKKKKKKK